jgi:hypothetical protein
MRRTASLRCKHLRTTWIRTLVDQVRAGREFIEREAVEVAGVDVLIRLS